MAEMERPGAAHLELPEDIAREETDIGIIIESRRRRSVAEEKSIQWAVEMIEQAKHPLLLIGAGANRKMCCKMLRQFIKKNRNPLFQHSNG